jgi:hypothetical protein
MLHDANYHEGLEMRSIYLFNQHSQVAVDSRCRGSKSLSFAFYSRRP